MAKRLELAVKAAQKIKTVEKILKAVSLADRAAKKKTIHKNKAARIKSSLSKLLPKTKAGTSKKSKASKRKLRS